MKAPLPVGRVQGHRGNGGEVTVRVAAGDAEHWVDVETVELSRGNETRTYVVAASRSYRDRLVLKFEGIDDADQAAQLRGFHVAVARDAAPGLPADQHYRADLVGMRVIDEASGPVGRVVDVQPGAAHDLLQVETETGGEVLVPFVDEIVLQVREADRVMDVRLPDGLLELNNPGPRG